MTKNSRQRCGCRTWAIALLAVLLLGAAVTILPGCSRSPTKGRAKPGIPSRAMKPRKSQAQLSWEKLIADAKETCRKSSGVSVDFEAYHEYAGRAFGVVVVAWKDSEYEVDLYRYDAKKKDWETSPAGDLGVDVPGTAKKWGVPGKVVQSWIDEANEAMRKKYGQRKFDAALRPVGFHSGCTPMCDA